MYIYDLLKILGNYVSSTGSTTTPSRGTTALLAGGRCGGGGGGDGEAVARLQSWPLNGPRGVGWRRDLGLRLGLGWVRLRGDRRGGRRGLRGRAAVHPRRQEAEEADRA